MAVLSGCVRVSDGDPVAQSPGSPEATSSSAATSSPESSSPVPDQDTPGIEPTQRAPVPAGSVVCGPEARPPVSVAAAVADPAAPRLTVGVPDGWSFTKGTGDEAVKLQGPEGMSASVTIAPTTLGPEAAFREYTDGVMAKSAVSTVSILPAPLCAYSGQKLMGGWSDTPQTSVEFYDRILHVWTNGADYLIAIHVEGPSGVDALDAASDVITDDVELTIP